MKSKNIARFFFNLGGRGFGAQNCGDAEILVSWLGGSTRCDEILVKMNHIYERKLGANVGVHDEKRLGIAGSDLISKMVNGTRRAQRGIFLKISVSGE